MQKQDSPRVLVPPPLLVLATLLAGLGLDDRYHGFPAIGLSSVLSLLLATAGLALVASGLGLFKRSGTSPEPWKPASTLVTGGIYTRTRNPMYLGLLLVYASLAILFRSPAAGFLFLPLLLVFDRVIIRREEDYLSRHFGPDYEAYKRKVRRWL